VERIIRYAFEYARRSGHTQVAMADKSNALTYAGSLWQRTWKEVGDEYPDMEKRHFYIDALCLAMVREPQQFQVIVTNNLFGDIITDLGAALQGGLGMAASGNIHPGRTSMFEPVHGSAPAIAGKNVANPIGAIATAAMMLSYLTLEDEARRIEAAIAEAVRQRKLPQDVGGTLSTWQCGQWIADYVQQAR
jgi:3-isopropylmalate dehydrogenase